MQKINLVPEMRYFYLGSSGYKVGDPVIAFGYILKKEDKTINYSMTICSPKDKYVKDKARIKLQKRMLGEKYRIINYTFDKPTSHAVLEHIINDYHWNNKIETIQFQSNYYQELGMKNRPVFLSDNLFEQFPELNREKKNNTKVELIEEIKN